MVTYYALGASLPISTNFRHRKIKACFNTGTRRKQVSLVWNIAKAWTHSLALRAGILSLETARNCVNDFGVALGLSQIWRKALARE